VEFSVVSSEVKEMCKPYLHCLALSFLFVTGSFAQQNPTPGLAMLPNSVATPEKTASRIRIDLVVTDKSGKRVPGLDQSDFTLLDNGQPGKIVSFNAVDGVVQQADPPVEIMLLIDTVNADVQETNIVRDQTKEFLLGNDGHLAQPVSVFVLTDQGLNILAPPSIDGKALAAKVGQLVFGTHRIQGSGAWGQIRMFDLSLGTLAALSKSEARKPGRKLLIWFGSGWPMFDSNYPPAPSDAQLKQWFDQIVQLSTQLRAARISVYSVMWESYASPSILYEGYLKGVKMASKANIADLSLKVLAVQSGGRIVGPDNHLDLAITSVVEDASAFYTLSFDAPRADGPNEYHDLKVQIDKPGLKVRTSTGYYNQPQRSNQ
jgi:VWFA-related protein